MADGPAGMAGRWAELSSESGYDSDDELFARLPRRQGSLVDASNRGAGASGGAGVDAGGADAGVGDGFGGGEMAMEEILEAVPPDQFIDLSEYDRLLADTLASDDGSSSDGDGSGAAPSDGGGEGPSSMPTAGDVVSAESTPPPSSEASGSRSHTPMSETMVGVESARSSDGGSGLGSDGSDLGHSSRGSTPSRGDGDGSGSVVVDEHSPPPDGSDVGFDDRSSMYGSDSDGLDLRITSDLDAGTARSAHTRAMDGFPGDGDHPDVRSPTMDDQEVFDGMRERERHAQTFLDADRERERLEADNARWQHLIAEYFEPSAAGGASGGGGGGQTNPHVIPDSAFVSQERHKEQTYYSQLREIAALTNDIREEQFEFDHRILDLQDDLDQAEAKEVAKRTKFLEKKRAFAQSAVFRLSEELVLAEDFIAHCEKEELKNDFEVSQVRIAFIRLSNERQRLESQLRAREEVSGLHMIDFEQKKIENQNYNEKIEERSEEILKNRKKITANVQILTHLKEKLAHVEALNTQQQLVLDDKTHQVEAERDALGKRKRRRDTLRTRLQRLREQSGLVGNARLLKDYEDRCEHVDGLEERIAALRQRHAELTQEMKRFATPPRSTGRRSTGRRGGGASTGRSFDDMVVTSTVTQPATRAARLA